MSIYIFFSDILGRIFPASEQGGHTPPLHSDPVLAQPQPATARGAVQQDASPPQQPQQEGGFVRGKKNIYFF